MADIQYEVGDSVHLKNLRTGTIKFIGFVEFAEGRFFGVELDRGHVGKNDGSYGGKAYFQCTPGQGLFVREKQLRGKVKAKLMKTILTAAGRSKTKKVVKTKGGGRRKTTIPRMRKDNASKSMKRLPSMKKRGSKRNLFSLNLDKKPKKRNAVSFNLGTKAVASGLLDSKESKLTAPPMDHDEDDSIDFEDRLEKRDQEAQRKRSAESKSPTYLVEQKEKELEVLRLQIQAMHNTNDEMKSELESSQVKLKEAEEKIEAVQAQNAKLTKDYENLKDQLNLEREANEHAITEIRRESEAGRRDGPPMPPSIQDMQKLSSRSDGETTFQKKTIGSLALPTKSDWNLIEDVRNRERSIGGGSISSDAPEVSAGGAPVGGEAFPKTPGSNGHDPKTEAFANIEVAMAPKIVADLEPHDRILIVEASMLKPGALKEEVDYYHEILIQQCKNETGTLIYDTTWNPGRRKLTDIILFENLRAFLTHLKTKSSGADYSNFLNLTTNRKTIMYIGEQDMIARKKLKQLFRKFPVEFFIRQRSLRRVPQKR